MDSLKSTHRIGCCENCEDWFCCEENKTKNKAFTLIDDRDAYPFKVALHAVYNDLGSEIS